MFNRILVGIDEETRGRDAIALTRRLRTADSEIILAHVFPAFALTDVAPRSDKEQFDAPSDLLTTVAQESGLTVAGTRWVGSPNVGTGVRRIARAVEPDLLVVGSTGRGKVTRTLLGNPTTGTLTRAGCVVAIAPEGYADRSGEIRTVGVAFDGSPASDAAVELAGRLAETLGAELASFEVLSSDEPTGSARLRRRQTPSVADALASGGELRDANAGLVAHLTFGDTIAELERQSGTLDVLVAGARGVGRLARALHGSTTTELTDVVKCPLVIVTKGAREQMATISAEAGSKSEPLTSPR